MKKLLVFVAIVMVVLAAAGCRERIMWLPGGADTSSVRSLLDALDITVEPTNTGGTVTVAGFPDTLPEGFGGLDLYIDTDTTDSDLGTLIGSGITADTTVSHSGLTNGTEYYAIGVGTITDDTISLLGIGYRFYPRPGGFGDYLGYPGGTDVGSTTENGVTFNRTTGEPTSATVDANADFFCYISGSSFYMTNTTFLTGGLASKIVDSEMPAEKWLEVQEAPTTYLDTTELVAGEIYHIKTYDDYYGKVKVDSIKGSTDTLRIWLTYAFQTAHGVGKY